MVDRLFRIVYLLIEKPKLTAKELASILEVSERTIYRDIDKISMTGVPIYTEQGRDGGIYILDNYILNKTLLTDEEKIQLGASFYALNELSGLKSNIDITKFQSFFGDNNQEWLEIDFSTWGNTSNIGDMFERLKTAVLNHQYVVINYSSNKGVSLIRKMKPLKMCFKNQAWYVYGYCCWREDYRFFKLNRISEILKVEEYFSFEKVGNVLQIPSTNEVSSVNTIKISLEIDENMAFRAYDDFSNITCAADNKLLCEIEIKKEDIHWLISCVLSYGPSIEILKPESLKKEVANLIEEMSKKYNK